MLSLLKFGVLFAVCLLGVACDGDDESSEPSNPGSGLGSNTKIGSGSGSTSRCSSDQNTCGSSCCPSGYMYHCAALGKCYSSASAAAAKCGDAYTQCKSGSSSGTGTGSNTGSGTGNTSSGSGERGVCIEQISYAPYCMLSCCPNATRSECSSNGRMLDWWTSTKVSAFDACGASFSDCGTCCYQNC